jgi:nicotinate-nucleotide adenylyltransferase
MFGGAFDPPHRAHVALAEAAVRQLGLDRLYVFPTGQAWHKDAP